MSPAKLLSRFTFLGSVALIFSYVLPWHNTLGSPSEQYHPLPVLFLGLALLIFSILSVPAHWYSAIVTLSRISLVLMPVIISWLILSTLLVVVSSREVLIGAGPIVAFSGAVIFGIGAASSIHVFNESTKKTYRILNTEQVA